MRQKDAEMVATILGNELRTCAPDEYRGIEASIGAVCGHMEHVHPEFDRDAYLAAVEAAHRPEAGEP